MLVLDGRSNDDTLKIANLYAATDARISVSSEEDKGIYDAMNKGLGRAKGDWIFFMGSDDAFYSDDVLQTIAETIEKNTGALLVYGNVQLNKPIGYHHTGLIYAGEFDAEKLLKKNICHQSAFYHRSLFATYGLFKTAYPIFADYDFNLRCFNRIKSVYLDCLIAHFNVGGLSKDRQGLDASFEKDFVQNMALRYSYNYKHHFFNGHRKELLALLKQQLLKGRVKAARRIFHILTHQALIKIKAKKEEALLPS